jgi:ectoine hydroxylase-related dioxygenase (phytanoyl-CoA dioxygenase family)
MNSEQKASLSLNGTVVPPDMVSELAVADKDGYLDQQLSQNGYLLLRGAHDPGEVAAARMEVLQRLAEVGEINEPVEDGIASGTSCRRDAYPAKEDLGGFWRSVSEGPAVRAVINGARITDLMSQLFLEPAAHFTFAWLRAMAKGRASPLHIDHPYMNRGSKRLVTCWTPLCDISLTNGPLYILEGSHRWSDIREEFEGHDVDRDPSRPGHIKEGPVALAKRKESRLLTSEFGLGDCLVFGMFTVHGSFDNNSEIGAVRVSCDTRFQPAAEPMDERFSGPNPPAHNELGYACLSASLPMTETSALR